MSTSFAPIAFPELGTVPAPAPVASARRAAAPVSFAEDDTRTRPVELDSAPYLPAFVASS